MGFLIRYDRDHHGRGNYAVHGSGAWGIIPAHINELSPDQVRGFLPGFAYQCGNFIAASIASVQSALAKQYPYPLSWP